MHLNLNVLMLNFLRIFIPVFLLIINVNTAGAMNYPDQLPECIVISHCVRENWKSTDIEKLFKEVVDAVESTPRTIIVEQNDSFIHAEAKTRWRKYTDDLLIKAFPSNGFIQVRSESRVGIGDNGVNKKRVDKLASTLNINTEFQRINKF